MQAVLQKGLAQNSPPPNPNTPYDRSDPREDQLLDLQRIRRALEVGKDHQAEGDPVWALYSIMHSAITRLRDGVGPEMVKQAMIAALSPPPTVPGGMGMPVGGLPPPGQAPTAGAPPPGGAPPVSPGSPPQMGPG